MLILLCVSFAVAGDLNLTILYDNNPYVKNLKVKWGFSCLIESSEDTILFDTGGDGSTLLENMEKLKINPGKINKVVISHIHYDHIGGLMDFLKENNKVCVYILKSFPESVKKKIKKTGAKLIEVRDFLRISKNVYSTGELGTWIKEQSLIIKTKEGLVIITGCAHLGIVNIIRKAKRLFKDDVYLVLGGFHLSGMSISKIEKIVEDFKNEKVKMVAPCHCSGDLARKIFEKNYGDNFILAGCGTKLKIKE